MLEIKVLKPGLQTTIQDKGRVGYQHQGVPVGGTLDRAAAQRANALVGNPAEAPVLEITLSGPSLQFSATAQIAVTGAQLEPQLDGKAISNDRLYVVHPRQVLDFGRCSWGCRAYLAIHGQWQVDYWLGSASRALAPAQDCTPAAWLKTGDVLRIGEASTPLSPRMRREEQGALLHQQKEGVISNKASLPVYVDPAPEYGQMSGAWLAAFFTHTFTVSVAADRMGCRLSERMQVPAEMGKMLSSGVLPGTVQLTPAGHLIILLGDAQTTGGYYRIAQLTQKSLDALAQLKPGDPLRFLRAW